jgi:hypothetical protein
LALVASTLLVPVYLLAIANPVPGQPAIGRAGLGLLWLGAAALGLAFAIGSRAGRPQETTRDQSSSVSAASLLWIVVPAGFLIPAMVPTLFGYDSRIVIGLGVFGLMLPVLAAYVPSALARYRAYRALHKLQ